MEDGIETIKRLRKYPHPADFFKDRLPEYVKKSNDQYIQVRRAFHEILGYPVGVHAGKYKDSIFGIHQMSLINALRQLEQEGKVERRTQGVWVWKENGEKKQHGGKP